MVVVGMRMYVNCPSFHQIRHYDASRLAWSPANSGESRLQTTPEHRRHDCVTVA